MNIIEHWQWLARDSAFAREREDWGNAMWLKTNSAAVVSDGVFLDEGQTGVVLVTCELLTGTAGTTREFSVEVENFEGTQKVVAFKKDITLPHTGGFCAAAFVNENDSVWFGFKTTGITMTKASSYFIPFKRK